MGGEGWGPTLLVLTVLCAGKDGGKKRSQITLNFLENPSNNSIILGENLSEDDTRLSDIHLNFLFYSQQFIIIINNHPLHFSPSF